MPYTLHVIYNDTLVAYKPLDSYSLLQQILYYHRSVLINEHDADASDVRVTVFDANGEKIDEIKNMAPSMLLLPSYKRQQFIEHAITLQLDDSFYGTLLMRGLP